MKPILTVYKTVESLAVFWQNFIHIYTLEFTIAIHSFYKYDETKNMI